MSKWFSVKEHVPPKRHILVICKLCGMPHTIYHDYGEFCHYEYCDKTGPCGPGESVEFDWWMPLPEPPKEEQ